jgi:hypothetical protein
MRSIFLGLLIMAVQPMPGLAQQTASPQQESSSYELWLVRSQTITADLIKDSADLPPSDRALLWAKLAQRWWQDDPEKARSWMLKPIEWVEAVPNKENPDERSLRVAATRQILQIVTPLDQKLSARLVAVLKQDSEQEASTERAANADGLIEAARLMVDSDPKRAAELGMLAIRVGPPTDIGSLLWRLLRKDSKLADALFAQALAKDREAPDGAFLFSLLATVFPEYFTVGLTSGGLSATDFMKREILTAYAASMQANRSDAENCLRVISIAPVLAEFDRLLPQQSAIVRQSINQCRSLSPLGRQRLDDALREQPLNTVDELLKAADDAADMKVRTVYQFRAAQLAWQQNDDERALKILDSMGPESREFMGGTWENARWDWAANAALRHLATGDVAGMRLIIRAVPSDLQPFAKMAFVDQLPADRNKDTDPTLEFLSDARTRLRSSVSDAETFSWYFVLLKLTVKYQPSDSTAVLKEAVAALNSADEAEAKKSSHVDNTGDRSWFNGSDVFSAALLEMDEYAVREGVSSISSANTRVQVRLGLLRVCLEQMRSSKQTAPKPKSHRR